MLKQIVRRVTGQSAFALAVTAFAMVLTVVLCHLHRSAQTELQNYQQSFEAVPVFMKVTDLNGSKLNRFDGLEGWVVDLFTQRGLTPNLSPYVSQMHLRATVSGQYYLTDENGDYIRDERGDKLLADQTTTGISSTYVAEELTPGWGGKICWKDGYDESILLTEEFVLLVPQQLKDKQELELVFYHVIANDGNGVERLLEKKFTVVGYYEDPGNTLLYCPFGAVDYVHGYLGKSKIIEAMGALLNDNHQLDALREVAAKWFAEPNPLGEKTPWGRFDFEYYLYALDIDDTMLQNLSAGMKNSIQVNQLASMVVFILSAGAGFLTGFLVIRSRKKVINLMRTMGVSAAAIFAEFALEQLLCVAVGIGLGGCYFLWQPMGRLALFGGIYTTGLALALVIFLRKNLLTTIKEDE